ncbi:MAG: hypothetical protein ABSG86_32170 [Thermoguttaceae bacterium]|jgi:hypothetical protein
MEIKRSGSRPSGKGPAEYFTGAVRIDPLFETPDPGRALGVSVKHLGGVTYGGYSDIPIRKVNEAYERLLKSDVKYRFSIDMASLKSE